MNQPHIASDLTITTDMAEKVLACIRHGEEKSARPIKHPRQPQ